VLKYRPFTAAYPLHSCAFLTCRVQRHGPATEDSGVKRPDKETAARKAAEASAASRKNAAAEAAKAQAEASKAQKDRVKALRASGPNKPKVLSPLVVAKQKRDEERARAKAEMAALKVRLCSISAGYSPASDVASASPCSDKSTSRKSEHRKRESGSRCTKKSGIRCEPDARFLLVSALMIQTRILPSVAL
jgi:membrane protein involved in colicin uptake